MCKAFSCLITKSKKVYWKTGVDGHDKLQNMFAKKDKELKDDKDAPHNTFARIEIVPKDGNYLNPKQKWVYQIDEKVKPDFLTKSYEKICRKEWKKWFNEAYLIDADLETLPKNEFIYVVNSKIAQLTDKQTIEMYGFSQVGEMWGSTTTNLWSKSAKIKQQKENGVIIVRYEDKVRVILAKKK
jgi:hypothetical protein